MKRKRVILAAAFLLFCLVTFGLWRQRPVSVPMRLELTGTEGLPVAGTVVVDGTSRDFHGVLPTSVSAVARTFEYTILMQQPKGELHGRLTVANGIYGSSSTSDDFTGVRGSYAHTWRGKGGGFTTARKGE
jgi:hypothetical protein